MIESMEPNVWLECSKCGLRFTDPVLSGECPRCGGPLLPHVSRFAPSITMNGVWGWKPMLFSRFSKENISLGEGWTPFLKARKIAQWAGTEKIFLKVESRNPTGTFIDRGSATLVSVAKHFNARKIVAPSMGDMGISLSSYCRKAGIRSKVFVPEDAPAVKVGKTLILADEVVLTKTYEEALKKASKYTSQEGVFVALPGNPYLLDGYRTLAYELLSRAPEIVSQDFYLVVPVGNGALITALYTALKDLGIKARFIGVKGCIKFPTIVDIYVESPLFLKFIEEIIAESKGYLVSVCEDEALEASLQLSRLEGFLTGPVGAASIAALRSLSLNESKAVLAVVSGDAPPDAVTVYSILSRIHYRVEASPSSLGRTKAAILEVLSIEGPKHPYGIWKALVRERGFKISLRAVYQHVYELVRDGYISPLSSGKGYRRRLYTLTPKALDMLKH